MSSALCRATRLLSISRPIVPIISRTVNSRMFASAPGVPVPMVDSDFISRILAAEKELTGQTKPVAGGPAAKAQSHAFQPLTPRVIQEITLGEIAITGEDGPVASGPTAIAQSLLEVWRSSSLQSSASGVLDSETISAITEKEKEITGHDGPIKGGPTAKAQQHAGEPITSQALHDITEGEKKITDGERVKGGPTSKAQSELAKSRQQGSAERCVI